MSSSSIQNATGEFIDGTWVEPEDPLATLVTSPAQTQTVFHEMLALREPTAETAQRTQSIPGSRAA